jgi:hypothetical protein
MLRFCKSFVSRDTLKIIYIALILPHFDYCSLVWSNCSETLKLYLQKLQNRAARVITGDNYDVRSKQTLLKLGWKTLDERRQNLMEKCMSKSGFSTSEFFRAKRPFSFVGVTYYVSETWQNGCRQRKKVASREKIR